MRQRNKTNISTDFLKLTCIFSFEKRAQYCPYGMIVTKLVINGKNLPKYKML